MRQRLLPLATLAVALTGAAASAVLAGCGDNNGQTTATATGGGVGGGTSSGPATSTGSGSTSTGGGGKADEPYTADHAWTDCQASDQAWVRRAMLAVSGRRSWGQAEVNAYEDIVKGVRKADLDAAGQFGSIGSTTSGEGQDLPAGRRLAALAMMQENAFRERWSDFLMDALHVVRIETKAQDSCYGPPNPNAIDDGSIAAYVRDHEPGSINPPLKGFTMGQLLSSAIQLDDLSVVYRGHLFAMMNLPITGANVGFDAMERIRRQDFGAVFDSAYVHRDVVCLSCHNSEFSVTFDQDPAHNRHWPVPGLFELSLFGSSNGKHDPAEEATKGPDDLRAHSMLRVADVVGGNQKPWSWAGSCGAFSVPQNDDPLAIDTYFGSIRTSPADPKKGARASVWDLEHALHRGVDLLAAHGLRRLAGNELADPDEAFAYLVAENIVERVWGEMVGTHLTIANYFARTEVQRDILMGLTEHFVATHFSLKALILDVLAHPVFNLKSPDEGCGAAAYEIPNILDPWTTSDNDLSKRGNSPADGVFAISSRPLVRSLHRAMEWPYVSEFPGDEDAASFEIAIGFFIKDADPGYRGLDFQGRLTWEATYAQCQKLSQNDFISKIAAKAQGTAGSTVGEAVIAMKDRLVGIPAIEAKAEQPGLEALIGGPLSSTDLNGLESKLRSVCGVLVSTPQFMLGGIAPKDTRDVPKLTPNDVTYDGTCGFLAQYLAPPRTPYVVTCAGGAATVKKQ